LAYASGNADYRATAAHGTQLAAPPMDETVSLDLNGKLALRVRLVRRAGVATRNGWDAACRQASS